METPIVATDWLLFQFPLVRCQNSWRLFPNHNPLYITQPGRRGEPSKQRVAPGLFGQWNDESSRDLVAFSDIVA
jgi:hypothetical protein